MTSAELKSDLLRCLKRAETQLNKIEKADNSNVQHNSYCNISDTYVTKREMKYLLALSMFAQYHPECGTENTKALIKLYGIQLGSFKTALNCCDNCIEQLYNNGFLYVLNIWSAKKLSKKTADATVINDLF